MLDNILLAKFGVYNKSEFKSKIKILKIDSEMLKKIVLAALLTFTTDALQFEIGNHQAGMAFVEKLVQIGAQKGN